jgi:hypothetical protein
MMAMIATRFEIYMIADKIARISILISYLHEQYPIESLIAIVTMIGLLIIKIISSWKSRFETRQPSSLDGKTENIGLESVISNPIHTRPSYSRMQTFAQEQVGFFYIEGVELIL